MKVKIFLILIVLLIPTIRAFAQGPTQSTLDPIPYPEAWRMGGPVEVNSEFILANYHIVVTVNINDGTTVIWKINPGGSILELTRTYAVVGRLLPTNWRFAESTFNSSEWAEEGYLYDGQWGILWYPPVDGVRIPRTTFTPVAMFDLHTVQDVNGFGGLAGFSNVGLANAIIRPEEEIIFHEANSDYSIHRIPQGTADQEILLREPALIEANQNGHPLTNPSNLNRSSGCVNYEAESWNRMVTLIAEELAAGRHVGVIMSYPGVPQDNLIRPSYGYYEDPMSTPNIAELEWNGYLWGHRPFIDQRCCAEYDPYYQYTE